MCVGDLTLPYEATVEDGAFVHRALGNEAYVVRERSEPQKLSAFLDQEGCTLWFEQEVVVEGSVLYELEREQAPIDPDKLVVLSWEGRHRASRAPARPGNSPGTNHKGDIARGLGCRDR